MKLNVTHIETRTVDSAYEAAHLAAEWVAQGWIVRTDEVENEDDECFDWTVTRWQLEGAKMRPDANTWASEVEALLDRVRTGSTLHTGGLNDN